MGFRSPSGGPKPWGLIRLIGGADWCGRSSMCCTPRAMRAGHLAQGITGIPWYYRQFDYEYAIDLDGGRCVYPALIAPLQDGETEAYHFRLATPDDLPLVMALYDRDCARSLVACPRSVEEWRRNLFSAAPEAVTYSVLHIIETQDDRAIGVMRTSRELSWRGMFPVRMFNVIEGQSLRAVLPSALRWLKTEAEAVAARAAETRAGHSL